MCWLLGIVRGSMFLCYRQRDNGEGSQEKHCSCDKLHPCWVRALEDHIEVMRLNAEEPELESGSNR